MPDALPDAQPTVSRALKGNSYDKTQRNSVIRPVIIAESSNNSTFNISFSTSHLRMYVTVSVGAGTELSKSGPNAVTFCTTN